MSTKEEFFDYLFKVVIVGDTNAGKTNILSQLINGESLNQSKPTIGVEFHTKTYKIDHNIIKVQFWDTAGQERYQAITSAYYRGSFGAVIVYDITQEKSLQNAKEVWLKNLKNFAGGDIPIILLGNKTDLEKNRIVRSDEGEKVAVESNIGFFETSAKSGTNINLAFEHLVKKIFEREKRKEKLGEKAKVRREDVVFKSLNIEKNKKRSSCC